MSGHTPLHRLRVLLDVKRPPLKVTMLTRKKRRCNPGQPTFTVPWNASLSPKPWLPCKFLTQAFVRPLPHGWPPGLCAKVQGG